MNVEEFLRHDFNRRQFLGKSAQNAAGMAAGMVGISGAVAKATPGERVSLAVIGTRKQGTVLATGLAALFDVDIVAVCDVDKSQLSVVSAAVQAIQGKAPREVKDFRHILEDPSIDAVVIATPDHWHALMTGMACQAGKDVYVEKPVSHTIREGERIVKAATKYKRVVQSGLQQRSGAHFQSAVDYVRSGQLGKVNLAKAWMVHRRKGIGRKKNGRAPDHIDYDMWLGPAPRHPFNPNRFHHNWRWFWDYGAGELGNWGTHMLDIARWGLGVDLPTRVSASGGNYHGDDDRQTPDTLVVQYSFPGTTPVDEDCRISKLADQESTKTIVWEHRAWSTHGIEGRSTAAAFYGELGTLIVDRGGWKVYDQKEPVTAGTSDQASAHYRNFINSVKTRQNVVSDIQVGHITSTLCHLGNIAYRIGRGIQFDPTELDFGNDSQANDLLDRAYYEKWASDY